MIIPGQFGFNSPSGFREEQALESLWLTYITGFFMNFELLPILTDYAN
jgi:hypothetical protein